MTRWPVSKDSMATWASARARLPARAWTGWFFTATKCAQDLIYVLVEDLTKAAVGIVEIPSAPHFRGLVAGGLKAVRADGVFDEDPAAGAVHLQTVGVAVGIRRIVASNQTANRAIFKPE